MSFLTELQRGTNQSVLTENYAVTNASSLDAVLDFFGLAGAMRDNVHDAKKLFRRAFAADEQLAIRTLFYLRDIRGGQGERNLFRELFRDLYTMDAALAIKLLPLIPEYGRWDDFLALADPTTLRNVLELQLGNDLANKLNGKPVSLLAKWLPSENASSAVSRESARAIAKLLDMSNRDYRKLVVSLRTYINLLEQKMSAGEWSGIEYDKLPSQAGRKYSRAFGRHDATRYGEFLGAVMSGEKKMNAGTVFTYEVFDALRAGNTANADALWASLPDYTNGTNALVIADVSGSMMGRPMDVSVSLALYFAEHNTGPFHNYFMTFSRRPQLVEVSGRTLSQRLDNIERSQWDMNTDVEAAFRAILSAAKRAGAGVEDIPKVLYIVSDMEFDQCVANSESTNFDNARRMFDEAGFTLPHVVFWNVNARHIQTAATKYDSNVTLISGLSQSAFKFAVEGKNPVELMLEVLNSDRYSQLVVDDRL